jgi:hypothetical protein
MKKLILLLLFIHFIYTFDEEGLNYEKYKNEKLSFAFLSHLSDIYGAKMPLIKIYNLIEEGCNQPNLKIFENVLKYVDDFGKAVNYLRKADNSLLELTNEDDSDVSESSKFMFEQITIQNFMKILNQVLKCSKVISDKLEAGIKLVYLNLKKNIFKDIRKYTQTLIRLSNIASKYKLRKLNPLFVKIMRENEIGKMNKKFIYEFTLELGIFLRNRVLKYKKLAEEYLIH